MCFNIHVHTSIHVCTYTQHQVLSESVSKALKLVGGDNVSETAKFVAMMDKFFDTLNVSNFTTGKQKRKPFQNLHEVINKHFQQCRCHLLLPVG